MIAFIPREKPYPPTDEEVSVSDTERNIIIAILSAALWTLVWAGVIVIRVLFS